MTWAKLLRRFAWRFRFNARRAGGSPARPAAEDINEGAAPRQTTNPPIPIGQFQAEMRQRLAVHRGEFGIAMEALIEAAVRNYKKMLTVAQTQPDQRLRSSLTTHADQQLIRSLHHMLHNQEQFDSFIASLTKKIAQ